MATFCIPRGGVARGGSGEVSVKGTILVGAGESDDNDFAGMELPSIRRMPIPIIAVERLRQHALPWGGVGTAMLRNLILVLVSYPLLMPPGMCMCGAACREGGEVRFCNGRCADPGVAARFEWAKTTDRSCNHRHDVPTDDRCSPNCPGNENTDHSKLVLQSPTVPVALAAIRLPSVDVDTSSGQRLPAAASSLFQPSAQPIYLTLCTLVV